MSHAAPPGQQRGLLVRAYRGLIRLTTSRSLRNEYGEEMVQVFMELMDAARARGGSREAIRVGLMEARQLVRVAVDDHRSRPPGTRPRRAALRKRPAAALANLGADLRYAARSLGKKPAYSAAIIAVLALGIGLNGAVTYVARSTVAGALPFAEPERLVVLQGSVQTEEWNTGTGLTIREIEAFREHASTLEDVAIFSVFGQVTLTSKTNRAELVRATFTSPAYFRIADTPALHGRTFAGDIRNAPAEAVLSYRLWQRHFGGAPDIIGQTVRLTGRSYTVIGVMPQGFHDLSRAVGANDVWLPVRWSDEFFDRDIFRTLDRAVFFGAARLAPGAAAADAEAEIRGISAELFAGTPQPQKRSARVIGLRRYFHGDVVGPFAVVFAGAVVVLLVCCANVTLLILTNNASRRREIAVRTALGAARLRLVRLLLMETLLLVIGGQVAGIFVAQLGITAYERSFGYTLVRFGSNTMDVVVFAAAAAALLLVAVGCSVYPAWRSTSAIHPTAALTSTGERAASGARPHRGGGWRVSLGFQVALASVLLVGAGLMVKSLAEVRTVPLGFAPKDLHTFRLDLTGTRHQSIDKAGEFAQAVVARLDALPGVASVGLLGPDMLGGGVTHVYVTPVRFDAADPDKASPAQKLSITPEAFATAGFELLRGRSFDWSDRRGAPLVAVVGERLAARVWPGQDPIGQRFYLNRSPRMVVTVVGIARAAQHRNRFATGVVHGDIYFPFLQNPSFRVSVLLRSSRDLSTVMPAVRGAVASMDRDIPLYEAATMTDRLRWQETSVRVAVSITVVYAVIAAGVCVLGIVGILLYQVEQARREIAVRHALGGNPRRIARAFSSSAMVPVATGVGAGLLAAALLSPRLGGLLYHVTPHDPVTYALVAAIVLATAVASSYAPARAALRVHPTEVLRPPGSTVPSRAR